MIYDNNTKKNRQIYQIYLFDIMKKGLLFTFNTCQSFGIWTNQLLLLLLFPLLYFCCFSCSPISACFYSQFHHKTVSSYRIRVNDTGSCSFKDLSLISFHTTPTVCNRIPEEKVCNKEDGPNQYEKSKRPVFLIGYIYSWHDY